MEPSGKILLVDDEPFILDYLTVIFEGRHKLVTAPSGGKALELAKSEQPDLILLDIKLPDFDGYDVCTALKEDPETAEIPVIFLTARNAVEDEVRGLECGAVDYITKPLSDAIVKVRVENHLRLKRYSDVLKRQSSTDGVTGIFNRRYVNTAYQREWSRARRTETSLAVVMMDIDYFKPYNDTYGHLEGDNCLRRIADAIEDAAQRPGDIIARYGGEEFIAVLADTDREGAYHMAESFRLAVEALAIPHLSSEVADIVTLSAGVATLVPADHHHPHDLIEAADKMLYKAKAAGRNCVLARTAEPL